MASAPTKTAKDTGAGAPSSPELPILVTKELQDLTTGIGAASDAVIKTNYLLHFLINDF